jgi:hypothetical protein
MRTSLRRIAGTALATAALALGAAVLTAVPAGAATPAPDPGSSSVTGYDVSHPQCDQLLPAVGSFAVVGVNGGLASTANPCLADQLAWAAASPGAAGQPGLQLYLNTADPGEIRRSVASWPAGGSTPYGECDGGNSTACSWQYGWERAQTSVDDFFGPAATTAALSSDPADYTWWLDVETANTWQSGSDEATTRNRAALEGMTAYLDSKGARVGLYSTAEQWTEIAGSVGWDSNLHRLPSWLAGATDPDGARAACSADPLVAGGDVALSQYVTGGIDGDVACW